ncbi:MAG: autoinducer 2 ABC transporter substrate-binding protein [Lachnospiraceae bacterium]|nr:autoinducer 2 ABC transporter substrate-binding protein [Lachnospiraceae bacterium]
MKKKVLALVMVAAMALGMTACGAKQEAPAADEPAKEEAAVEEATEEPAAEEDAAEAPAPSSDYEIAVVVKVVGIDYFNVFEDGVKNFADEYGVNAYVTGPSTADAAEQVNIINDLVSSGVDALVVVPNDATVLESALQAAQEKGVVVVTTESPAQVGADYDVELIINDAFAELVAEDAAKACNGTGEYALYVGGLTVPLHNAWADHVEEYLGENYPEMKLATDRIACGEDAALARETTLDLMKTYPDLTCIIGFGSQGPIGAAEALTEENKIGEIAVLGNIIPSEGSSYLESGAITSGYLWSPFDAGMASCYIAKTLLDGETIDENFKIPNMGDIAFEGTTLWIDNPIVITADNWESFGF